MLMPSAKRARRIGFGLINLLLWCNTIYWTWRLLHDHVDSDHELAVLIMSIGVAAVAFVVNYNGQRIDRMEQVCCSLTRIVLTDGMSDEPEDRRRHLSAVR